MTNSTTCHNLCEKLQPTPGFNQLLGLGLNFCIEQHRPKPNVKNTMEKLKKSIRLRVWTEENGIANDEYIKNSTYLHDGTHPLHQTKQKKIYNALNKNKCKPSMKIFQTLTQI